MTPVYNGEKYLDECIQSVLAQTYQNWEYIILNNCSTDRTIELAEKYAKNDERIKIYNNNNFLSVIENHNQAFRKISHDSIYCKVVHADDFLFPQCIELMVGVAEANPSVGIVGSYGLWGNRVKCDGLTFPSEFVRGRRLCRLTLLGEVYLFLSPTALLIRSEIIRKHKCFYNEQYLHSDVESCYETLRDYDFGFVHQVLTFIRKHDESATSTIAAPFNRIILSNLDLLTKYGPVYLTTHEYDKRLRVQLNSYYRFLARSLFQLRGRDFWNFHKDGIQEFGYKLNLLKLIHSAFSEILSFPKKTIFTIVKSVKGILMSRLN